MAFSTSKGIFYSVAICRGECLFTKKNCRKNHFCFCPPHAFFSSFAFCFFDCLFVCFFLYARCCYRTKGVVWIFPRVNKSNFTVSRSVVRSVDKLCHLYSIKEIASTCANTLEIHFVVYRRILMKVA